ncbi:hypothetical protein CYMTET_55386, partial [Cymbomonas tetramitiformis]
MLGDLTHVWLRNLHFFGTSCCGAVGPSEVTHRTWAANDDIRLEGCHFLYSPSELSLLTTERGARGSGGYLLLHNNTVAFGEKGSLYYKANGANVSQNYFLFNSLEDRNERSHDDGFTIYSQGYRDLVEGNSLLYNGEMGGVLVWALGFNITSNLIQGQSYLAPWKDSAGIHMQEPGQWYTNVTWTWILGPSNSKSIRTDTSSTVTEPGRYSTISHCVFLGTAACTIKGNNHSVTHNTGDSMDVVWDWGAIHDHNSHSTTAYNGVERQESRGSASGTLPGWAGVNACSDMYGCNPENASLPDWLSGQLAAEAVIVCDELEECYHGRVTAGFPQEAARPLAVDFRPKPGSSLLLEVQEEGYDEYIGALSAPSVTITHIPVAPYGTPGATVTHAAVAACITPNACLVHITTPATSRILNTPTTAHFNYHITTARAATTSAAKCLKHITTA